MWLNFIRKYLGDRVDPVQAYRARPRLWPDSATYVYCRCGSFWKGYLRDEQIREFINEHKGHFCLVSISEISRQHMENCG